MAPEVLQDRAGDLTTLRAHSDKSASYEADVPELSTSPVVVGGQSGSLNVTIPVSGGPTAKDVDKTGLPVFDHRDGSRTVPIVKKDQSVQIVTILDQASAPETYTYDLSKSGASAIEDVDGHLVLRNGNGEWMGGISPAWAKDAAGNEVPTRYIVDGLKLTQLVNHRSASTSYPVVADPWLGIDLFEYAGYGSYNGDLQVNLRKSAWGQSNHLPGAGQSIFWTAGWDEARTKVPDIQSKETLHQQYDCHVGGGFGNLAGDWNLERFRPDRTETWVNGVAFHRCNWTSSNLY